MVRDRHAGVKTCKPLQGRRTFEQIGEEPLHPAAGAPVSHHPKDNADKETGRHPKEIIANQESDQQPNQQSKDDPGPKRAPGWAW